MLNTLHFAYHSLNGSTNSLLLISSYPEMTFGELTFGEMILSELTCGKMTFDEMTVSRRIYIQ